MKPIKYLGQNFLTSKKIVEDIIRAADIKTDDIILEVGPGKGILTEAILEKIPNGKLIAVEKDKRLADYLKEKFKKQKNLEIIEGDILKINPLVGEKIKNYKIVANIPYYLTSRLLRQFLQSDFQPIRMVLMVQKEVAERITCPARRGKDKKESIISISVKVYGEPKIIKKVPASYFSPKPKVDSAILLIDNISKDFFKHSSGEKFTSLKTGTKGNLTETKFLARLENQFFGLVRQGFSSKRKLLKNNLKLLNIKCLIMCGISEKARAEELSTEDWKCLQFCGNDLL